ncbi:hypothetical protein GGI12_000110 [Dipsacomyces acuminosporus]|nr:hypothetical protein GGI12_000110 [Dipsacomyces acuminosporus]
MPGKDKQQQVGYSQYQQPRPSAELVQSEEDIFGIFKIKTQTAQQHEQQHPIAVPAMQELPPQQRQPPMQGASQPQENASLESSAPHGAVSSAFPSPAQQPNTSIKTSGGITIQSLLNASPSNTPATTSTAEAIALHQHIAKENARHRRNSNARKDNPLQHPPVQEISAVIESSHHSRSSYHSAGYSIWHGRAETVNQDFATAQQSLSSNDGAGSGFNAGSRGAERVPAIPPLSSFALLPIPAHLREPDQFAGAAQSTSQNSWSLGSVHLHERDTGNSSLGGAHKPISVRAQKGDDSPAISVSTEISEGTPASSLPPMVGASSTAISMAQTADTSTSTADPFIAARPGRKATSESLENVLEYYRTGPETLDDGIVRWEHSQSREQATALQADMSPESRAHNTSSIISATQQPLPALDLALMEHHASTLSSLRYPADDAQPSPLHQRTSLSSPIGKPEYRAHAAPLLPKSSSQTRDAGGSLPAPRDAKPAAGVVDSSYGPQQIKPALPEAAVPEAELPEASFGSSIQAKRGHEDTPIVHSPQPGAASKAHASSQVTGGSTVSSQHWHTSMSQDQLAFSSSQHTNKPISYEWQLLERLPAHSNVYDALDDLPEPDDLVLPPAAATGGIELPSVKPDRRQPPEQQGGFDSGISADGGYSYLQMESIGDSFSNFSDMGLSGNHGSECEYATSDSSTDSFGEPIAHETGFLSAGILHRLPETKTQSVPDSRVGAAASQKAINDSVSHLADKLSSTDIRSATAHHVLGQSYSRTSESGSCITSQGVSSAGLESQAEPLAAASSQRPGSYLPDSGLMSSGGMRQTSTSHIALGLGRDLASLPRSSGSVRTNTTTFTTSTNPRDNSTTADTNQDASKQSKAAGGAQPAAAAASAASATTAPANPVNLPLEIMELASELEMSLARDQEDYFTDNGSQPMNSDILHSLGKAVHRQCLHHKQQIQRRKSNMQLGLSGGNGGHDERSNNGKGADETQGVGQQEHADTELELDAMLSEVSQYFTQTSLRLVFPFSARWIEWLTRHPDRPFPWRKDPDDDTGMRPVFDGDRNEYSADDTQLLSYLSSFGGGDLPVLSRVVPPEDVLNRAMTIPMSKRRAEPARAVSTDVGRTGITAHWEYYRVINQIISVASGIHRQLQVPIEQANHTFIAHQLSALYQFLGGDLTKYKTEIESIFGQVKHSLGMGSPPVTSSGVKKADSGAGRGTGQRAGASASASAPRKVLDSMCAQTLSNMMSKMIADVLYSTCQVATTNESDMDEQLQMPNAQSAAAAGQQDDNQAFHALSTLKSMHAQPIVRYLNREMRVANTERRRRGFGHNLSRNSSISHLRQHHHLGQYQNQPPLPPLPQQVMQLNNNNNNTAATASQHSSSSGEASKAQATTKAEIAATQGTAALSTIFSADESQPLPPSAAGADPKH